MKKHEDNLPIVAICGRTNVGKSTLFNRLIEKRQALVSDIEGTTRDCNLGVVRWNRKIFRLVDTAGLSDAGVINGRKKITPDIDSMSQQQALNYLSEAKLLLFIVDGKAGLTTEDRTLAKALRQHPDYSKKTLLVVNKIDSGKWRTEALAFNKLAPARAISLMLFSLKSKLRLMMMRKIIKKSPPAYASSASPMSASLLYSTPS